MRPISLVSRGLRFYWRTHLGVAAGAAVAAAVLVGALVVGDSVRGSLRAMALARLGQTRLALSSHDRFFRAELAEELAGEMGAVAPVLRLEGMAVSDAGARANGMQLLGVDERFWRLGGAKLLLDPAATDQVVLNGRLARQLQVGVGQTVLLRAEKPGLMPREAPMSTESGASVAFRLTVAAIATDADFGRFDLRANQLAPYNAFVPLAWLGEKIGRVGRANVLLVGPGPAGPEAAQASLRSHWRLADAELELRRLPDRGVLELRSGQVFLDPAAVRAALAAAPEATKVLTYFVNEIRAGDRATPYSMVAAVGAPPAVPASAPAATAAAPPLAGLLPPDMADDEILINTWLAEDLGARPGESVELSYFVLGPMRKLEVRSSRFRVRAVVELAGLAADRELMPDFPGLADVANCRDWQPGVPIDLEKIRKKDEQYWESYRGTPKAFVTLRAGQRVWANRFGELTGLRWPAGRYAPGELAEAIRGRLDPASMGLFFQPVRRQALAASAQSLDFGQLFLGLSFFLILAALMLMGLLFVLGVEQRGGELGALLALGFPARRVRRLLLIEGGALALAGTAVGTAAGVLYTRAVLYGLSTLWRSAVAHASLGFYLRPVTLAIGAAAGLAVAILTMWLALVRQVRRPARELLAGEGIESDLLAGLARRRRTGLWVAVGSALAAAGIVAAAGAGRDEAAAGAFFTAGGLLLISALAASMFILSALARRQQEGRLSLGGLGLRNGARRRLRSLAVVALLACGSFLVVAVGANRHGALAGAERRSSGTGGFAFYARSALPVFGDLNSPAGREPFGLAPAALEGARIVQLRLRPGDEASCLNLNRAQSPQLLGVRPEELASRGAFTFLKAVGGASIQDGWSLLDRQEADGAIPAIGDEPTVTWALGRSVGKTLPYVDGRGRTVQLRIVGTVASSILQGSLLVSEANFRRLFGSADGYNVFLVDAPPGRAEAVGKVLSSSLRDLGLELTPAPQRLAAFNAVEDTYLSIFQALGGLGLVLGSVGMGVVVLRNVLERRGELALLRAVGFSRRSLQWLVLSEHWSLLALGLAGGVVSALLAVLPALRSPAAQVPYLSLALTLAAVGASGAAWTYLATLAAVRGPLLPALRNE